MTATVSIATPATSTGTSGINDTSSALRFITCGSVDDGKSTLIGRLLVDSRSVLQDQLANVSKSGEADLALFTDGLSAEREQGITIDVAYRYFATPTRKFIIGDAPGHEQYTRNMVTAASSAHAAVVLVDATKLKWNVDGLVELLPQTRRHSLLVNLLRVPGIIFAVNKLDALGDDAAKAFAKITEALQAFAAQADIAITATIPMSALKGHNVVTANPGWCGYTGPSLLALLETLPVTAAETDVPFAFPVQWVEKFHDSADTSKGRRVFWGRVATGTVQPGDTVSILPSGKTAVVAQVLNHARVAKNVGAGHGAGLVLDREVDVSRGDWILASNDAPSHFETTREIKATVAWMDDEPLVAGRVYLALHGHRWIKAKVKRIVHSLDINTLEEHDAKEILPNAIGHIEVSLQEPIAALPYAQSRVLGSLILVDTASHKTSGALLLG
ncbi:MAG: sulfate adenylyltransferase [Curvibacter sp. RIFCSPHIGHO2_12_FULL_63_18]|uniref:sulfate adenylyltransferase subunit 1 n=1 Tax=Rhodoferax sp. TaxID=50421 RepID=UPI0008B9E222|nr:GTP-binding protein [Rhodoferax sp.]OGO96770.1 MAG: sulfate adenylyltransferase [Curvibacter sp. GWA2_63_95]OGP00948.1 MAG: sulfate adenylyltransferase [Curvibacter sp. RIFCSPHIGHO2_12_FULL_63_18]